MKKSVLIFLFFFLVATPATAQFSSIYEYLQKVDNQYFLVLGLNGKGGDTLAAIDVATGLKRHNPNKVDLETGIEDEINPTVNKILIGHPCDNSLIPIDCSDWPYKKGEALIQIIENDLIIAGTTVTDTRRAAKIIESYPQYALLRSEVSIIVTGKGVQPKHQSLQKAKSKEELVCGDLICEPGESTFCFIDCAQITCFEACNQEGFASAACRDKRTNPNVPSCLADEADRGLGYCATDKVCCCEKKVVKEEPVAEETTVTPGPNIGAVIILITLMIVVLLIGFLLIHHRKK